MPRQIRVVKYAAWDDDKQLLMFDTRYVSREELESCYMQHE